MELGGEAPLEARDEALFELGDFAGRLVAGENDLFAAFEERIEGVEELLLRALFAGEELDVVDEQDVGLAVPATEFDQGIRLNGIDELVGEGLAAHVSHLGPAAQGGQMMADGLEEVGLAETDPAVDEERVVGAGRGFGHGQGSGVGEFTVGSDHERIEHVVRVEPLGAGDSGRFRRLLGRDGLCGSDRFADMPVLDPESDLPLGSKDGHQRGLQLRAVITLDPDLIDAVGNNQRDLARIGFGQAQCGKPSVVNSLTQFRPQGR